MEIKKKIPSVCLCVLFAIAFALTGPFSPEGGQNFSVFVFIAGLALSMALLYINGRLIKMAQLSHRELKISDRAFFIRSFVIFAVFGFFTQLVYFPATLSNDTIVVIRGGMGVSGQHPWMYIALLRGLEKIVRILGGADNEVFIILAFLQVLAVSFSYSLILTWLKKKGVPKAAIMLFTAFFALCPILNLYMVTLIKDVPFALGTLLILPLMYELWESDGEKLNDRKFLLLLMACSILFFFRSNGAIVCILLAVYVAIAYRKYFKRALVYLLFVLLLIAATKTVQKVAHAPYKFREAVGIPIQQVAATVCSDGKIGDKEFKFIDRLKPVEEIKSEYDPYNVDRIKYGKNELDSEFLNVNRGEFLRVWATLLKDNFAVYVEAYLKTTYGFWSFTNNTTKMRYTYIGAFADQEQYLDWMEDQGIVQKSVLPPVMQGNIEGIYNSVTYFLGAGVMAWLILCLVAALMGKHGRSIIIVGLPAILCWLTLLISTPIAFQWRYALSFAYTLPILYGIALIPTGNRK